MLHPAFALFILYERNKGICPTGPQKRPFVHNERAHLHGAESARCFVLPSLQYLRPLPSPPLPNPPPQVTILEGTATWCAQCKAIAPEIAKLAHEYPGVKFFLYDVEECEDLAHELGVTSMPSFSVFRDGEIQEGVTGARLGAVRKAIEACL